MGGISDYRRAQSAAAAIGSTGDKFIVTPSGPIDIVRWGVLFNAAITNDSGIVALDKRVTAGSDTGRLDAAGGTLTVTGNIVAGKGIYVEPSTPLSIDPGQEAVFEVTDAAQNVGNVFYWYEFIERPFVAPRIANMTKVTV